MTGTKKYIESVQADSSQALLIDTETGAVWGVDRYALKERGYPEGNWRLLDDVSKEDLVVLIHKLQGYDTSEG